MSESEIDDIIARCNGVRREGNYKEAIDLLTVALADQANDRLYYCRGCCYDLLEAPLEAVADFTRAIRLAPETARYYFERGHVFAESLFRDKEAIADFQKVVSIDSDNVEAHRMIGLCMLRDEQPERALQQAMAALQLAPEDAALHFCVGESQMRLALFDVAVQSLTRAVELEPDSALYWSALGHAYERTGSVNSTELATKAYSEALRLNPKSPSYLMSLGELQLKSGNPSEAIASLRRALTLNPSEGQLLLIQRYLARAEKANA